MDGHLQALNHPPMTPSETKQLAYSILTDNQKHRLEEDLEIDLSFGIKGLARFRANIFHQRGAIAAVFRQIPFEIKGFKELGLPAVIEKLCEKPRGLILVTGPTGSGKSTTLAAMLDKINRERAEHMITIEDPVEFLHSHKKCLVNQREVHADTHGFSNALRSALRQDPDVVLIGEMRDLETIESALRIAETGHLTFATLHTNSAAQSINRIIDVFPAHQQGQIRAQLSLVLEGIVCQALLPKAGGKGRAMAMEILIPQLGDPQPDPRGQGAPDLRHDADRPVQVRDADVQPVPGRALLQAHDQPARRRSSRSSLPDELQEIIDRGPAALNPNLGVEGTRQELSHAQLRMERPHPRRPGSRKASCSPTRATRPWPSCAASRSRWSTSARRAGRSS